MAISLYLVSGSLVVEVSLLLVGYKIDLHELSIKIIKMF